MRYVVSEKSTGGIALNETDTVASVIQNIRIILSTRQGTVPHYREFGLPMNFLDKPANVAQTMMISEITEAIQQFEPRALVVGITFETDANDPGRLIPAVEVEINL